MKKLAAILSFVVVGTIIWFSAASKPEVHAGHVHQASDDQEEVLRNPHGRVLYAVVDRDGVYLGTQKFELAAAKVAVAAFLKEQKIPNLIVYGTNLARYGDVIELYAGIDPSLIKWSTFSFEPLPMGTRKPLFGFLKRDQCCGYYDSENEPNRDQ